MKINLDVRIQYVLNILNEWGKGYLVGGALRDLLLGIKPNDYDLATNISLDNLLHIFSSYNPTIVSYKYQIINITVEGLKVDIARFRVEQDSKDGRNPTKIRFVDDIKEDLKRRDFSVNAMAYNDKELIDIFNGLNDLKEKKIDIISNNKLLRFEQDHTRVLRALYLIAKYDFTFKEETKNAIDMFFVKNKLRISDTNYIKLINKILFLPYSYKILKFMFDNNILEKLSPSLSKKKLNEQIIDEIIKTYKIYCKYNAYEEKTIAFAILFIYIYGFEINIEKKLKIINILNEALSKVFLDISDIIITRNMIYYSDIVDKSMNKSSLKRILFEFRNNQNISKLLTFLSFINHNKSNYTDIVKKILGLLSKIQSIYFENEPIFINDLDINITDICKLDFEINKEYLRQELFYKISEKEIKNDKEDILKYIINKYNLKYKIKKSHSYGGIVYRIKDNNVEFLIIKVKDGNWGFPKGGIEGKETTFETAIREIKEETSLDVELIDTDKFCETISYITNNLILKYVSLYLAKTDNFDENLIIETEEIDEYKWCRYNEALKYITYTSQREILHKARLYLFK